MNETFRKSMFRPMIIIFGMFVLLYLTLIILATVSLSGGVDGQELNNAPVGYNAYVAIENYSLATIPQPIGQIVRFRANNVINNVWPLSGSWFALLNNGVSNSSQFFFLQNGLAFYYHVPGGSVAWTTSNQGLLGQQYSQVPYIANANVTFEITKPVGSPNWRLCATNSTPFFHECRQEPNSGTALKFDINTSIFVENTFQGRGWENDIQGNFKIDNAYVYTPSGVTPWTTVHRHTDHGCTGSYPVIFNPTTKIGAIKDSPINLGLVEIKKKGVPTKRNSANPPNC